MGVNTCVEMGGGSAAGSVGGTVAVAVGEGAGSVLATGGTWLGVGIVAGVEGVDFATGAGLEGGVGVVNSRDAT